MHLRTCVFSVDSGRVSSCSYLDGVHQVLYQEEVSELQDNLVEFAQSHVTVLVDRILRQRHVLVKVLPERTGKKNRSHHNLTLRPSSFLGFVFPLFPKLQTGDPSPGLT